MNYLSIENISKRFGEKLLFEDVTFGIDKSNKVALVARNGAGKTSLLKLIYGIDTPDSGKIVFRNDIRVAYLEQDDTFNPEMSILDAALNEEVPAHAAIRDYQKAMEGESDLENALEKMNRLSAWDADVKLKEILTQLKLEDFDKKVKTLSGGQKKRLALSKLLAAEPDFMILDEPTNHLDLDMIEWLETELSKSQSTLLMVTHDRYFLENVCDTILELDRKTIFKYEGNFSDFLRKKQEREEIEHATVSKAKNLYRKELEWMRRMPKARGTKAKARQDAFYETEQTAKTNLSQDEMEIRIKPERLGSKIIELHKISYQINNLKLIDHFHYIFKKNEKIGIVGPNGIGKSTLLKLIMHELEPDKGKIVHGETLKLGYYSQHGLAFKESQRVIEVIKDVAEIIPAEKGRKLTAAQMLEKFMFPRDMHWQYVSTLSGGERKRLYLLRILMANPNFLILDEPTNDLDIYAMAALEDYLLNFSGCVLVVSHDRFFLDKLSDHLFVFMGDGKIKTHPGGYSNYLAWRKKNPISKRQAEKADVLSKDKESEEKSVPNNKTKLSFKEKYELDQLTEEIEVLEKQQKEMNLKVEQGNIEDAEQFYKELADLSEQLESKTLRWMELAEYA